ncbi:hypothetical protein N7447_002565 [Penicillium robsamsonii]|uniref:uncharacterized protein n=1 Tax=Penicillium robsamsonii TaxID=1792511 RepID=UPI00254832C3|nr:uncharacterized protein N7447_002565 [Penicillium robsamsonii]KAJ5836539.1 hypothetical protein N7447_002565 [Penicillium robsamsonii]
MPSRAHLWLLMLLPKWTAASPVILNEPSSPYPQATPHPSAIEKRGDGAMTLPASECGSPCTVSFEPVTTTVIVSVPAQTVWVASITQSMIFDFTPVTTTTVFQPSAQTFPNDDPVATPAITLQPLELGTVAVFGSEDMDIDDDNGMDIDDGGVVHHEHITLPVEYMVVDNDPVQYTRLAEYNPYNLDNNCAIITMSYLMGISLDEFIKHTEIMQPGSYQPGGITTGQIQEYLEHTGRKYAFGPYDSAHGNSLNEIMGVLGADKLGVCFIRDVLTGHCVVWENGRFWDFQTADNPIPYTEENGVPITDYLRSRMLMRKDTGEWIRATSYIFAIY